MQRVSKEELRWVAIAFQNMSFSFRATEWKTPLEKEIAELRAEQFMDLANRFMSAYCDGDKRIGIDT